MIEKNNSADFRCASYAYMSASWQRTMDVWGGVRSIRDSKTQYLTQFSRESDPDYQSRVNQTEFYNVFGSTVDSVVGMICVNEIAPTEAPAPIAEMFSDIDLCGNDLAAFLRETETNAIRDGHSFIFVDAPPPVKVEDGTKPTLADVGDRRPFWVNYKASQAINWQYEVKNGKLVLIQVTFEECTNEPDGLYGEKTVTRYRVLKRGSYSLYEKVKDRSDLTPIEEDQPTGVDDICLSVVYARRTGPLESKPPFLDLLETNIAHYNSRAILREALKYIVPMPVFHVESESDAEKFQQIQAASNRSIIIWGEHADAKYIELEGKSMEEHREEIANLEMRMAKLGVEKFAPIQDGSNKTATEVGSDNRKEMSEIAVMAKNLENAVEGAFYFTAELIKAIKGPSAINLSEAEKSKLKLNIDYDKLTFSLDQLQFLEGLADKGRISNQTFLEFLPQVTAMPKSFNVADEQKRLLEQESAPLIQMSLKDRVSLANQMDGLASLDTQLKVIHPDWTDAQIAAEVVLLRSERAVRDAEEMNA